MLDTITIGLLRLDSRNETRGFVRVVRKSNPQGPPASFFRVPLHVVFDLEGYNSYKEYVKKANPEFKTWIGDVVLDIPPTTDVFNYPKANHEWFLGKLYQFTQSYVCFPSALKKEVEEAVVEYREAQLRNVTPLIEENEYDPPPMTEAEEIAANHAVRLYTILQRSRFDPGTQGQPDSHTHRIHLFSRNKQDKTAKQVIEEVSALVAEDIWKNPTVSKYSETVGAGLKIKLTVLFLAAFYKEHIQFMKEKLEAKEHSGQAGETNAQS